MGNSRLFIRVQYAELVWHDWIVILRDKKSSSQNKVAISQDEQKELPVEESKNPDDKKNPPRAPTVSS